MIDTICIGTGGIKGISYVAALNYLEKQKYINFENINLYTSVSVGSIISVLLIIGYKINEIYDLMQDTDYNEIKPDLNLDLIINKYGFDDGEKLMTFLKNILLKKINNSDITFLELYKLSNKELCIVTTNFSKNTEKIFNYKDTPNVSILLALRMSISVPLVYTPCIYENDYYVDGGLTNNVYIPDNCNPENTLILIVDKYIPPETLALTDIIVGSICIMIDKLIKKDIEKYNCLKINCANIIFSSECDITKEMIELLILNGECSAENYLKRKIKYEIEELKKNLDKKKSNIITDVLDDIIIKIENHL